MHSISNFSGHEIFNPFKFSIMAKKTSFNYYYFIAAILITAVVLFLSYQPDDTSSSFLNMVYRDGPYFFVLPGVFCYAKAFYIPTPMKSLVGVAIGGIITVLLPRTFLLSDVIIKITLILISLWLTYSYESFANKSKGTTKI